MLLWSGPVCAGQIDEGFERISGHFCSYSYSSIRMSCLQRLFASLLSQLLIVASEAYSITTFKATQQPTTSKLYLSLLLGLYNARRWSSIDQLMLVKLSNPWLFPSATSEERSKIELVSVAPRTSITSSLINGTTLRACFVYQVNWINKFQSFM